MKNTEKEKMTDMAWYGSGHVGSFGAMLSLVRDKIQASNFSLPDRDQAEEIVRIIAEMMILPEAASVSIGGVKMPAGFVREIYAVLEHDHVQMVLDHYKEQRRPIRFPKTYLRTALYNAVFELESRVTNDVRTDLS